MSVLHSVFYELKEKCKVKNSIVNYARKHDEFFIYVCLQKDIKIKNEKKTKKLKTNCYKHGICYQHMGSSLRRCLR